MIKAIFFDFDGVLTTDFNGSVRMCENLCEAHPDLLLENVTNCYNKHCRRLLLDGKFSEVWEDFCLCVGRQISTDTLKSALRTVTRNDEMIAIAESLRTNYKLGIITDNFVERMNLLDADMNLSSLFNPIVVSGAVHVAKYDGTTAMYDVALKSVGCEPSEALFIDNQKKNLDVPSSMGMHTYWHNDATNDIPALVSALKKLGVLAK